MRLSMVLIGCIVFSVAACGGRQQEVSQQDIDRARQATMSLKKQLIGALTKGLEQGPDSAIVVCKTRANEIAAGIGGTDIQVGRTSHKLRNPANAPEPWMEPLLAAYSSGREESPYRALVLEDGVVGYVEPLYIKPMCLTCHGEPAGSLAATLSELYPTDKATGFKEGDFRGLVWAKMRPAPTR